MRPLFICPVCGGALHKNEKSLFCEKGHCFDIARQGYVNLLLSQQSSLKHHGDDKLMVKSRADFLEKGYYGKLKDRICEVVSSLVSSPAVLIDAGCGEGYYTRAAAETLESAGLLQSAGGIDISKDAVSFAAKRGGAVQYAVAGVFNMPLSSGCADIVLSIFAPFAADEFLRVLRPGGYLLCAHPLENHLMELKCAVYDSPYKNDDVFSVPAGFEQTASEEITGFIRLASNEDIINLFRMTPYYYKTGEKDQKKLEALTELETRIEFGIEILNKKASV
ncbi:MAG: methyltransferase domain-containing protein [Clostridia bacterium]|nr:methyltransferase domain-containing protein [Clostridia bacterium]